MRLLSHECEGEKNTRILDVKVGKTNILNFRAKIGLSKLDFSSGIVKTRF